MEKRYNDFGTLRKELLPRFPNLAKLPAKKMFGSKDPNFVKERMGQLHKWLQQITKDCPALMDTQQFLDFAELKKPLPPLIDESQVKREEEERRREEEEEEEKRRQEEEEEEAQETLKKKKKKKRQPKPRNLPIARCIQAILVSCFGYCLS